MFTRSYLGLIPGWLRWTMGAGAITAALITLFLVFFNWNVVRGPVAREASLLSRRPIQIEGDLKVHLLSWTPSASVGGLKVGDPAWMKGGDLADVQTLNVKIKLLPLLVGRLDIVLLDLEHPRIWLYRDASDRANWRNVAADAPPLKLPLIQRFAINDGVVRMVDDKRRLTLQAAVQSQENLAGRGTFQLTGRGVVNAEPFKLLISGAPLLNVRRDRPYPFDADISAGATRVLAHGALTRPFDFGQVDTRLIVSGPDFADLYYLTGLALPNTGAYRLSGRLVRDNKRYAFSGVAGRVGDSDLEGAFVVDNTTGRPKVNADLRSRSLDFRDLTALVGAPSRGARHTPPRKARATTLSAAKRLLPDATLNLTRIRATEATVRFRADTVKATPHLPLNKVSLDAVLDHGLLTLNPITFGFPRGTLGGWVKIDAREDKPKVDLDLKVTNVRIEDFVGKGGGEPPIEGLIEARARLHGVGDSMHKAASTADGDVTVVAPRGEIRKAFAELLGVNVVKGLGLYLAKDKTEATVRCAVADFHAANGLLTARNIIIDTGPVLVQGRGAVSLGSETVDVTLQGHPKSFQLVHLNAPITVTGSLSGLHIGVKTGAVATQAASGLLLGVVLTPLAAILPFVDVGLAKNADCAALLSQAQTQGAPVKSPKGQHQ